MPFNTSLAGNHSALLRCFQPRSLGGRAISSSSDIMGLTKILFSDSTKWASITWETHKPFKMWQRSKTIIAFILQNVKLLWRSWAIIKKCIILFLPCRNYLWGEMKLLVTHCYYMTSILNTYFCFKRSCVNFNCNNY